MACEHKNIKSVNCVLYCIDCGVQLPAEFNQPKQEEVKAETKPKKKKGGAKE